MQSWERVWVRLGLRAFLCNSGHPILCENRSVQRGPHTLELRLGPDLVGVVIRSLRISVSQCADDPDAVCTRSVSVRLSALHNGFVKLKHGGGVAIDGQDVQIPFLQGKLMPTSSVLYQPMSLPADGARFFPGNLMKI